MTVWSLLCPIQLLSLIAQLVMAFSSLSCTQRQPDSSSSSAVAQFSQVCTLLLQSQQHNCAQDAVTFSRLLCVGKQLRKDLLHAAVGCIHAEVPRHSSSARTDRSMVHWLCLHMKLGTFRHVEVDADDFYPDLYLYLAEQLQNLHCPAPPCIQVVQQQQQQGSGSVSNLCGACVHDDVRMQGTQPQQQMLLASAEAAGSCSDSTASATKARTCNLMMPGIFVSWHVCGESSAMQPSWQHDLVSCASCANTARSLLA